MANGYSLRISLIPVNKNISRYDGRLVPDPTAENNEEINSKLKLNVF